MTFTPSALSSAFKHTHIHIPSTFETTLAQTWKHSTCNALHSSETDREARLQVGQHCVCDGANRRGTHVRATRFRILPGACVRASRGVRASAVWDDTRHGSLAEGTWKQDPTLTSSCTLVNLPKQYYPDACTDRPLMQGAPPMLLTMRMHAHNQTTHLSIRVFTSIAPSQVLYNMAPPLPPSLAAKDPALLP
jgi:hypothetical protein